jgi:hypothetical protein
MVEQEFHLPIDELASHAPGLLRGEAKKFLLKLDQADLNHDGKRDVAQMYKGVMLVLPLVAKYGPLINKVVDFDKLADKICQQDWVKDSGIMRELIKDLFHMVEAAGK